MTAPPLFSDLDEKTKQHLKEWLEGDFDDATKNAIKCMMESDKKRLVDSFYTKLSFGTGGLRGLMGPGTNRVNAYTVRQATQGLSAYILKQSNKKPPSVFVSYDSRKNSKTFAEDAARVFAANGIRVYLTKQMRPTPLVSFACRYLNCQAAVMITASHNPPEYNGYKVYWKDGAQVLAPHETAITEEIGRVEALDKIKLEPITSQLIEFVDDEVDRAYIAATSKLSLYPEENMRNGEKLKIVYTSLHGTGITLVPKILNECGFSSIYLVEQQVIPDGNFPTAPYPNPEEPMAMQLGIEKLIETNADLLIATDPDADRVGVAVMHEGKPHLLSGNQLASICLEAICRALSEQDRLHQNAAFIKTLGTTELFQTICNHYRRPCFNVLTGFKYIGQKIHEWEIDPHGFEFVFGGEESFGYLFGTNCRDKDALGASLLISEIALQAKKQNKTLVDLLHDLYREYGIYLEKLTTLHFENTKAEKDEIFEKLNNLRKNPPKTIGGIAVTIAEDYKLAEKKNLKNGRCAPLEMPTSDVLLFWLEDGTKLMIRPSGTEPKIKIYCGTTLKNFLDIPSGVKKCEKKLDLYSKNLSSIFLTAAPS